MEVKVEKQKPFVGSRIMLFRSKGNPKIFNLRTMSGDGSVGEDGKAKITFANVTGPNGHQMMGYLNEKSGHISIFESDPNKARTQSTNKSVSIGSLLSTLKANDKVLV